MSPVRRPYHYLLRSMPERSERLSDRGGVAVAVTQQSVASGSGWSADAGGGRSNSIWQGRTGTV